MSQLTVFVPDLFVQLFADFDGKIDAARWPALDLMLRRANQQPLEQPSVEHNLIALCGVGAATAASIPVAALTAFIDYDVRSQADIMRADPVHLRADPHQILLFNHPNIMPSAAEADSLLAELNAGLPNVCLSRGRHPWRWYFHSPHAVDTITSSPRAANGRSIADFLPRGAGAGDFAQLMNDAQMLLHNAAVNAEREARGVPPINSIWLWGGGVEREVEISAPDFVVGDDVLTAALARRFALDWCADPAPDDVIARLTGGAASGLAVIGSPTGCVETTIPIADIDTFEHRWCRILLQALRRFRIGTLQLITDRQCYSLTPWSLLKVWRRPLAITGSGT